MSPVAIGLDIFLAVLLLAALAMGARLNGRLKALREGQANFIKAVGDLDAAAGRAEAGLAALRHASEQTHDDLLTRIETARGLIAKLERASLDAERLIAHAPVAAAPAPRAAGGSLAAIAALAGGPPPPAAPRKPEPRSQLRPPEPAPRAPIPAPPPRRAARTNFDEDLFGSEAPLDLGPLHDRKGR